MTTSSEALKVLLIEDNPGDAGLIRHALFDSESRPQRLDWVVTLAEGKTLAAVQDYDAVLLDLSLPDSWGLRTVTDLRAMAPSLPIVVLTGYDDMAFALDALDAGAQDYLVKGEAGGHELIRSLRYARERQRLEFELETSRERFRSFAEAGSDWLWETDADYCFTYLSESFEAITGFPPSAVLGKCQAEFFSADIEPIAVMEHLDALKRHEAFKNFQYPLEGSHGELRYFRVSGTPVFSGSRFMGYRGVGTDVTRFRAMGQELRDRLNEIEYARHQMEEQAARMAQLAEETAEMKERAEAAARAKSDFLATMSHEIRTPMTGVLGMVDLLLAETMPDRQRQFVATIKEAGETLLAILNDILDISKLEAGRLDLAPSPTDVRAVIEGVCKLFDMRAADRGNRMLVHLGPGVPARILTDGHRLRQVLFNLVGNAVKFTEGGSVTVGVDLDGAGPDGDHVSLLFSVTDTGLGISPDQLSRLFVRFQQADQTTAQRYGGTGLGLALCKAITELMGGRIGVDSVPGKGSRFHVSIPVQVLAEETAKPEAEPDVVVDATPAGIRLLVAEDNRINQMLLREILGRLGEVVVVGNGQEAVDAFVAEHFDAIVMDSRMPVMGGIEAIRIIRATLEGQAIPILTLSADVMPERIAEYQAAGADASLGKPIDVRALITTMLKLLGKRKGRG